MTWTDPTSRSSGDMITAAIWNADVADNLAYLVGTVEPELTNQSGDTLSAGAVVIADTSNDSSFTTTTTADDPLVVGVVMETIANAAAGRVATTGVMTVAVQGNVNRGDYLSTSTTAGRAKTAGNAKSAATFARALTAYAGGGAGTVSAVLLPGMTGNAIPQYGVLWTSSGSAPDGYSEYTSARGRIIVGLVASGTNEGTVGTALTNLQNPTHTHSYSTATPHYHNITVTAGAGGAATLAREGDAAAGTFSTNSTGSASGTTDANNGATSPATMPYIQLMCIRKD